MEKIDNIHTHHDKNSQKNRNRGELPQLDEEYLQKPTANIILNDEAPGVFPLRQEKKARISTLTTHSTLCWDF